MVATSSKWARRASLRFLVPLLAGLVLASCSVSLGDQGDEAQDTHDEGGAELEQRGVEETTTTVPALPSLEFPTRPGPGQLTMDELPGEVAEGWAVQAIADNRVVAEATVAQGGTALIRNLPAGDYDLVIVDDGLAVFQGPSVSIPGEEPPGNWAPTELVEGFNYLVTRDGTLLSTLVTLPDEPGPYPTLVEYSGYSPSDPTASVVDNPLRLALPKLDYALVQVNIRGTGCSGGAFDLFERIQALDGYDVIETVAAQPWSAKVGMVGISYAGITQLHVASTRPPSLAAIAPLSVIDRVDSVLFPGGIPNTGFGQSWVRSVIEDASTPPAWVTRRIESGDEVCEQNQALRSHNVTAEELLAFNPDTERLSAERSPETYADKIDVPVLMAGAWQDERTGARFPALFDELSNAPAFKAIVYNGFHGDAVSPDVLIATIEFLNMFVADRRPELDLLTRLGMWAALSAIYGDSVPPTSSNYSGLTAAEAREQFATEPPLRVLFEQGGGDANLPRPSFEGSFSGWPVAGSSPRRFYFDQPTGSPSEGSTPRDFLLTPDGPGAELTASFQTDPSETGKVTTPDADTLTGANPRWSWQAPQAGAGVVAGTAALDHDLVVLGPASADLWVASDASDADLEVTVAERAPDNSLTYVQTGWLRLSHRKLAADSTDLRPIASLSVGDVEPLPNGEFVPARVEIPPFAHVFRAGSAVELLIDTPGGSRPLWTFERGDRSVEIELASGGQHPSSLLLSVLDDAEAPTGRPPCGTLRSQPCRFGP